MTTQPKTARIFISYSRKDGEDFAKDLRQRLETEFGEAAIWRDFERMEGGRDWWLQITEALDSVEFMILVATPQALTSEIVAKEWRYARQQGVCVYPVLVPGLNVDFKTLPHWMSSKHFYTLPREWMTFTNHLKNPCREVKVPFMAPDKLETYVQRQELYNQLHTQLLSADRQTPVAITTALQGDGGFGKTTLATALCHDEDIQTAFDDGILWVTLGQSPDVIRELKRLCDALSPTPVTILDVEDGAKKLADLWVDRDCLLVIDDVWNIADLRPFLRGGERCARLITTRSIDITITSRASSTLVDEMQTSEAIKLLGMGIEGLSSQELQVMAVRLGEWALMLEIANAILRKRILQRSTSIQALDYLKRLLNEKGILGIRLDGETDQRKRDARGVLSVSLDLLAADRRIRLYELSVFKDDEDIPLSSVMALWGVDEFDAEDWVQSFAGLSLVKYNTGTSTLRLHDVVREYLGTYITDFPVLHRRLVNGWGILTSDSDIYTWQYIIYHLSNANRITSVNELLTNYDFLHGKLDKTSIDSLIADYDSYLTTQPLSGEYEVIRLIKSALSMSAHVLLKDKKALSQQLVGRLMGWRQNIPLIREFTDYIIEYVIGVYPKFPDSNYHVLPQAGGSLHRTLDARSDGFPYHVVITSENKTAVVGLEGGELVIWDLSTGQIKYNLREHKRSIRHIALTTDNQIAISTSEDKTLIVWDLMKGQSKYILNGHTDSVDYVTITTDNQMAISASADGTLILWDIVRGQLKHIFNGHNSRIRDIKLSTDNQIIVSGSSDGKIIVWDITGKIHYIFEGHTKWINQIALTQDNQIAISASADKTLIVWDIVNGKRLYTITAHDSSVQHIAICPNGTTAVSADQNGTLIVWDIVTNKICLTLSEYTFSITCMSITPDGQSIILGSGDGIVLVIDLETGVVRQTLHGHTSEIFCIAITSDSRAVISASEDYKLIMWNIITSNNHPKTLRGHSEGVQALLVAMDGLRAISVGWDNRLIIWDVVTGLPNHILDEYTGFEGDIEITPDGKKVVFRSNYVWLAICDIESGRILHILKEHTRDIVNFIITQDGQKIISSSKDESTIVWDILTGEVLKRYPKIKDSFKELLEIFPDINLSELTKERFLPSDEFWRMKTLAFSSENHPNFASFHNDDDISDIKIVKSNEKHTIILSDVTGRVMFLRYSYGKK